MKLASLVLAIAIIALAIAIIAALFVGCSTSPAPRRVYKEAQFNSRLEYLQFCERYEIQTGRCK
jgi:hypothetical protein